MVNKLKIIAHENLNSRLMDNPCRGIVLGMNEDSDLMQLCWIMGRSPNSQNRVYVVDKDEGTVRTEAADPSKVKDPSLIIYNAMRTMLGGSLVVSNGDQTDTIYEEETQSTLNNDYTKSDHFHPEVIFYKALLKRFCEPDAPNFTPRISGIQRTGIFRDKVYISILKADPISRQLWLDAAGGMRKEDFKDSKLYNEAIAAKISLDYNIFPTQREFFELPVSPGLGYCITTYKPGSKNLPSFDGEPFIVPVKGRIEDVMQTFWNALEPEWKVALAGKTYISNEVYIPKPINKFKKTGGE